MVTVKAPTKSVNGGLFNFSLPISTRKAYLIFAKKADRRNLAKVKKAIISGAKFLRKTIAQEAPKGKSRGGNSLRSLIRSLNVTNFRSIGGGISIFIAKTGSLKLEINLGTKKHAKILWVDQGTGVFGPNQKPIRPVNKTFLRFKIGRNIIFAKEVQGQRPQKFIARAINKARPEINRRVIKAFT